jgi:flavin-dependent dehydrogenase
MSWIYLYLLEQCTRAGVRWMPATRFLSATSDPTGSIVHIEHGGSQSRLRTRYVVGADGPRSRVAAVFGLGHNSEFLVGVEDVLPSRGGSPFLHCFIDPRLAPGYIAWLADDGVESHLGVAGYRDRFQPVASLEAFRRSLPFDAGRAIERRGGLIPVNGILRRIANDRALLIGDAAGAVSPLTAGGLDAALRLSTFAVDVIVSGDLSHYNGDRFRSRFATRRFMRRALSLVAHPMIAEAGCALLRLPPLRRIAEHIFFSRGSFPDARLELGASAVVR